MYRNVIKRVIDWVLSLCAIVVLSPLLAAAKVVSSPVIRTRERNRESSLDFFIGNSICV